MRLLNYYERLGVTRNATSQEIKKQYYKLAKIFHPDKTNGDKIAEESFKLINEAYECLSDTNKRLEYDKKTLLNESTTQTSPPNVTSDSMNSFWRKAAAFVIIIMALNALLSNKPKPKTRLKKKTKTTPRPAKKKIYRTNSKKSQKSIVTDRNRQSTKRI